MLKSPVFSPIINPVKSVFSQTMANLMQILGNKNIAWFDFSDLNYMTLSSDRIVDMVTKSPTSKIFSQVTAGNRPIYGANGVQFLRTQDFLSHNGEFFFNTPGGFRFFATIINETEAGGADCPFLSISNNLVSTGKPFFNILGKAADLGSPVKRDRISSIWADSSSGFRLTTTATRSSEIALSTTEYNLVSMQFNPNSLNYKNFVNTVLTDDTNYTATGTITPMQTTSIGAVITSTGFINTPGMIVRDMLITTNDLTTAELDAVNGYMLWNCGQQAKLPSNHSYKYQPPYV